jgi:hypothetical protein
MGGGLAAPANHLNFGAIKAQAGNAQPAVTVQMPVWDWTRTKLLATGTFTAFVVG